MARSVLNVCDSHRHQTRISCQQSVRENEERGNARYPCRIRTWMRPSRPTKIFGDET